MKFRLLAQHVTAEGVMLEEGTEVGDDTPWPWKDARTGEPLPPTTQMEGLDDEGKKAVTELHQRLYGTPPYWEHGLSPEQREAREAQAEEQAALDRDSDPVSKQQEFERDQADKDDPRDRAVPPGPRREPSSTATAAPMRTPASRPAPGPATPKPPAEENVRPSKPNEEQYPKG